jgi:polysaccharide pyruvyl transferase WcaK-like protein
MDELIVSFDLIAARESKSVQNLRRVRPDARLVPDLCWCVDLDRPGQSPEGAVAILDCVDPATTARLGRVATTAGLQQFVMDRFLDSFHRAVRAGRPPAQAPRVLHRADIGAARGWLGGRFHGVVLALGAGAPILSTSSNTPKIEAMLSDIGLSGKALRADELDALTSLDAVESLFAAHEFTTEDWRKLHKYKAQARREIDSLFADLAALAADPA